MATVEDQFNQGYVEAMLNNLKMIVEAAKETQENQAKQKHGLQDQLNQFALEVARDNHALIQRTADNNAVLAHQVVVNSGQISHRVSNNAAMLDLLIASGEVDTTAQGIAGLKLSEEFRSAAKQAIEAAVAAVPGTSAASQGTTGVAQGALQTQEPIELAQILANNNTIQTAILKALADVNTSLGVILVKVTGEAVKVE